MPDQDSEFDVKVERLKGLQEQFSELSKNLSGMLLIVSEGELNRSRNELGDAIEAFQHGQHRRANALLDDAIERLQDVLIILKR